MPRKLYKPDTKIVKKICDQLVVEGYYCHVSLEDSIQFICVNTKNLVEQPAFRAIAVVVGGKANFKRAFNALNLLHAGIIQREVWTVTDEGFDRLILENSV